MEMRNHNYMEMSSNPVPRMTQYEDSEYYQLQYEASNNMQPIHYGGLDPNYHPYGLNYIPQESHNSYTEQPLSYHNIIRNEDVMPEEWSSYKPGPYIDHLDGSVHYPDLYNDSSYNYPNDYHTRYSDNAEQFYHGDDGSFENQYPVYSGFYYPNVYPYSYYSSPAKNANMPVHGYSRHFYDREYDYALYDQGNVEDPYLETNLSRSPCRGFDKFNYPKLPFEENVRSHNRELPSKHNYSQQQHVYNSRYNSEPTNTWDVASSPRALESPTTGIESGEYGKIQRNDIAPLDTKPASPVETEIQNTSTPTEILKEKKKKDKSSRTRRKRSKEHSNPIFHITWDGFGEQECETIGQVCPLCEDDLSFALVDEADYEYYEQIDEPRNYPEVSVLACGHVYHRNCLDQATTDEECSDPICYMCLSFES